MTFTSVAFLIFFPLIVAAYYACPPRFRWAVLLAASCYFYMMFVPQYILVLFFLIGTDFFLAQRMEGAKGKSKHAYFIAGLASNLAVLFVFKYFNFFNANISELAQFLHWNYSVDVLRLALPLGLSFHTFQSISYLVEVYRGKYPAERHLGVYSLYVMFFPQLIAGPIERPAHLLPQLKKPMNFDLSRAWSGLRLMAWGFFKKLVVADRLGISVSYIYANYAHLGALSVIAAMVFFAFQLYADFSGYTDIARGSARVLGIGLVRNFEQPYFSRSIAEFWRRWHISLSSWFRDYFYFPLVYSVRRMSIAWFYAAIIITFLVTGLWHGAGWTFIVMGALFGCYIVAGLLTKKIRDAFVERSGLKNFPRTHAVLQTLMTFCLVSIAWVFFRSPDLSVAVGFLRRLFAGWNVSPVQFIENYFQHPFLALGFGRSDLMIVLGGIAVLLIAEYIQQKQPLSLLLGRQPVIVRSFLYSSLCLAIILLGLYATNPFIYFQF
jgi:alginate O-acetyltransferase complex protein AlgI